MCNRVFAIKAWSRLGHRCDTCKTVVRKGDNTLVYLTIAGQYCSRECEALHTLNDSPNSVLVESGK